jgi:hypothetical protein
MGALRWIKYANSESPNEHERQLGEGPWRSKLERLAQIAEKGTASKPARLAAGS